MAQNQTYTTTTTPAEPMIVSTPEQTAREVTEEATNFSPLEVSTPRQELSQEVAQLNDEVNEHRSLTDASIRKVIRADLAAGKLDLPNSKTRLPSVPFVDASGLQPIISLTPHQSLRYRPPFGPAPVLPNNKLAFKGQILENLRQWSCLVATVDDKERRTEILDRVFEKYKQVWFEALRLGYEPYGKQDEQKDSLRDTSEQHSGDRKPRIGKSGKSRKRDIPPWTVAVFIPEKFKNGRGQSYPLTPITAGELQEAGLSEEEVRRQAEGDEIEEGQELLQGIQEDLDRSVETRDWRSTVPATSLNPTGRHLLFYSLYVAQLYNLSLTQLRGYMAKFRTPSQIRNGQKNINNAEHDRNLYLALASMLDKKDAGTATLSPDRVEDGPSTLESSGNDVHMTNSLAVANCRSRKLLETLDMIIEEADLNILCSAFEASGYPAADLVIQAQDELNPIERSKRALNDILDYAQERLIALNEAEQDEEESTRSRRFEQIEQLEAKIRERKKTLRNLMPLLLKEKEIENEEGKAKAVDSVNDQKQTLTGKASAIETRALPDEAEQPEATEYSARTARSKRALSDDSDNEETFTPSTKKQKLLEDPETILSANQHAVDGNETQPVTETASTNAVTARDPLLMPDQLVRYDRLQAADERHDEQASQQFSSQPTSDKPISNKEHYLHAHIFPMVNQLLIGLGQYPIDPSVTDFKDIKDALRDAGVPVFERNKVTREYNRGLLNGFDLSNEAAGKQSKEVEPQSMDKQESKPLAKRFEKDMTVDPASSHSPQKPSLVIKLGIDPSYKFNPEQFSCNKLYHHKGFRFRYTKGSTLAERNAVDAVVDEFVRDRRAKKGRGKNSRFGKYETIHFPSDPERKPIVHGIWDTQDSQLVKGAEWFYYPDTELSNPVVEGMYGAADEASDDDGDSDGIKAVIPSTPAKRERKVTFAPLTPPETPASQRTSSINPKLKTAIRLNVNADNANLDVAKPSIRLKKIKGKATATVDGRGRGRGHGGTERARGRPKRATTPKSYAMDDFDDESDDDWQLDAGSD